MLIILRSSYKHSVERLGYFTSGMIHDESMLNTKIPVHRMCDELCLPIEISEFILFFFFRIIQMCRVCA